MTVFLIVTHRVNEDDNAVGSVLLSVRSFVCRMTFEPRDLWPPFLARIRTIIISLLELKVNVIGQGKGKIAVGTTSRDGNSTLLTNDELLTKR